MRIIKLMPDYYCYPLWEASPGCVGNISPFDLPISDNIRYRIVEWASCFDDTLDLDNPADAGFKNDSDFIAFKERGKQILFDLRRELGLSFFVFYYYDPSI